MDKGRLIRRSSCALLLGVAVRALTACGHGDPPPTAPAAHSALEPPASAARVDRRLGVTEAMPPSNAKAASEPVTEASFDPRSSPIPGAGALAELAGLDDAALAAVVEATYQADVAHLQLALARAVTPAVLHFAYDSIQDRRAQAAQDQTVFADIQVVASPCAASERVAEEWQRDRSMLQAAPAHDFDRAFIDHHVSMDVRAVAVLDAVVANAKSPSLRAQLQSQRTSLAGHMREAQHLQQSFSVR